MNQKSKKLFQISIIKTVIFNLHYLGLKGLKFPIIVTKNFILGNLYGKIYINDNVKTGKIILGYSNVNIFNRKIDRGIWNNEGEIHFNGKCNIGIGTKISNNKNGIIVFGDNFSISCNSEIICYKSIHFGDNVLISWNCLFLDSDIHKIFNKDKVRFNLDVGIIIGNHVWIGCRSVILKGSHICDNSIVGANCTITKHFAQENIIIGNLNNVLKEEVYWEV